MAHVHRAHPFIATPISMSVYLDMGVYFLRCSYRMGVYSGMGVYSSRAFNQANTVLFIVIILLIKCKMLNYLHKSNNVEVHESVLHIVLHQRQCMKSIRHGILLIAISGY